MLGLMAGTTHIETEDLGPYFAQMAVWIEEVCQELDKDKPKQAAKLRRIIDDLLYFCDLYRESREY